MRYFLYINLFLFSGSVFLMAEGNYELISASFENKNYSISVEFCGKPDNSYRSKYIAKRVNNEDVDSENFLSNFDLFFFSLKKQKISPRKIKSVYFGSHLPEGFRKERGPVLFEKTSGGKTSVYRLSGQEAIQTDLCKKLNDKFRPYGLKIREIFFEKILFSGVEKQAVAITTFNLGEVSAEAPTGSRGTLLIR